MSNSRVVRFPVVVALARGRLPPVRSAHIPTDRRVTRSSAPTIVRDGYLCGICCGTREEEEGLHVIHMTYYVQFVGLFILSAARPHPGIEIFFRAMRE